VSESAVSAKQGWGWFGAKPAQSETPARAAAKRRPPGRGRSGEKDGVAFLLRLRMAVTDGKSATGGTQVILNAVPVAFSTDRQSVVKSPRWLSKLAHRRHTKSARHS
jgi:hypothetical protein